MSEQNQTIFYQSVADMLAQWRLPVEPWATQIVEQINRGTMQWQQMMEDGRFLHLLRVYAPIIQREEVFLGSVLLNDFFFKAMPSAAQRIGLTQFAAVANDLESAYFLACGELDTIKLQHSFVDVISNNLAKLYFGQAQPQEGIHGSIKNLFNFEKSDFEPFPIYAIPEFLTPDLERAVRSLLKELLVADEYEKNLKTVRATLSFFYGRTSGGLGDVQSFDMFVHRLVTEYDVIQREEVEKLLGIGNVSKLEIKTAFDNKQFNPEQYRAFLLRLLSYFGESIDRSQSDWFMGFIYKDNKLIPLNRERFLSVIFNGVQVGYYPVTSTVESDKDTVCCPVCGQASPYVRESYIIAGRAKGRFRTRDNKRGTERQEPIICAKCALCIYLSQRLLGNFEGVWQKQPRKTARMPLKHNLLFHYGQHTDEESDVFERQLDFLIKHARTTDKNTAQLREGIEEIRRQILGSNKPVKSDDSFGDWGEPAIAIIAQLEGGTQSKVLTLGSGVYRLFVFILPQFRPGIKESEDFIQERFSGSRLAAFTLFALLQQLCGCIGPYFYRSLPQLSIDIEKDYFYVQNQKVSATHTLRKYGAIVNFAKRVSDREGYSPLTNWILLAESLLKDPLGMFSDVLRASPIRTKNNPKIKYKRLSSDWDAAKGLGVVDSTEYMTLYEQLHELAKEID